MHTPAGERIRELEAELAATKAETVELQHILTAALKGDDPVVFPEARVTELMEQIEVALQKLREVRQAVVAAGYEPAQNAAVEGADAPGDAA